MKPGNVLLGSEGRVVLTDFGIATVEGSSALTMTGEMVGSPEFLAPERALGRTPGPESDLWSLGVLLYAAVEGVSPFRHDTPLSTLRAVVDEEMPAMRRAGPLAPVVEGLLRKDPAERLPADLAEHRLRLVAAGGMPRPGTAYAPTAATRPVRPDVNGPVPVRSEGTPAPAATAPARGSRTVVVLVAGVLAVALGLAGLTYALLNRDGGRGGGAASDGGPGSASGSAAPGGGTGSGTRDAPPVTSAGPSGTRPAQSVRVTLTGAGTRFFGACPPPAAQAPAFTATFTVGRLPAQVEYRWVARSGSVVDPGWQTLAFPAGGGRTRQDKVVVTASAGSGTTENAISVQVRAPVRTRSDAVPFSVTCTATETPTDGASASDSPSDTP